MGIDPEFLTWLQQGLNFNPYLAAFALLWDVLGLPSPLQMFMAIWDDLFGGRAALGPDSATDNTALALLSSRNPIVKQWGKGIRILERKGYPTSTGDPRGRQLYGSLNLAAKAALERQMPTLVGGNGAYRNLTNGARAHIAYVSAAFNRTCTDAPRGTTCRQWIIRIDDAWYIPLVVQGGGTNPTNPNPKQCACTLPSGDFPTKGA